MTTTDQRTRLLMSTATLNDLWLRASVYGQRVDAKQVMAAIRGRVLLPRGEWRVYCDEPALTFIREQAPDLARLWPAVFGDVPVPRAATLAAFAHEAIGQTVAGVEVDGQAVRVVFESGATLVATGDVDWRGA